MGANPSRKLIGQYASRPYLAGALAIICSAGMFGFSPAADHDRVRLSPRFVVGQILDYQIEMRNVTKGRATGLVEDPEAASQLSQSTTLVVRLEVLHLESAAGSDVPKVRIRATCQRAVVTNESDAYDAQAEAMADQYRKLEGHSLEFGLDPEGHVSVVTGLE